MSDNTTGRRVKEMAVEIDKSVIAAGWVAELVRIERAMVAAEAGYDFPRVYALEGELTALQGAMPNWVRNGSWASMGGVSTP